MSAFDKERDGSARPQEVLPASQYLQERLQERRSRNTRPKRGRHTDFGPRGLDDDIFLEEAEDRNVRMYDSSPLAQSTRHSEAGGPGSGSRRRTVGLREMDDQLDRLSKQNFALKLELDHRREQTTRLQERMESMLEQAERAEKLEEEHAELLKINSQLVDELEKRDKAVEEAMDIICELEDRIADFEDRNTETRPSTAQADSGYAGTETLEQVPSSTPPKQTKAQTPHINVRQPSQPVSSAAQRLQGVLNGPTPAKSRREPTIMSQKKPSTNALRSVYPAHQLQSVKSFHSLLSRQESRDDDIEDALHSPRLSVLSESSFPSIYSPKKQISPDRYAWEASEDLPSSRSAGGPRSHLRHESINRVSQWISERDAPDLTPSKSNNLSRPLPDQPGPPSPTYRQPRQDTHFQSLNDALTAVANKSPETQHSAALFQPFTGRSDGRRPKLSQTQPTSFGGPIFGEPLLPPTPESASTRMLRASRSSIVGERSLLDNTPAAIRGYDALEPTLRTAPRVMRSSIELTGAYESNLQHRSPGYGPGDSSSSDEDEAERNAHLSAFGGDFNDGYPDGKSIVMGTPSRFFARPAKGGQQSDSYFDSSHGSSGTAVTSTTIRSQTRRRRSSAEIANGPPLPKPRLVRGETSPPTVFTSLGGGRPFVSNAESLLSPRSAHSGSSGNRTVVQTDEPLSPSSSSSVRPAMMSPTLSATTTSKSLTGRAQGFFRRLSSSAADHRAGERSPAALPTLTSTPSSAYVNDVPIEVRRPRTSQGGEKGAGRRERERRPSLVGRGRTEPGLVPAAGVSVGGVVEAVEKDKEKEKKGGFFKRSGSVRQNSAASATAESAEGAGVRVGNAGGSAPGLPRRRGSVREAVNGVRRPWR